MSFCGRSVVPVYYTEPLMRDLYFLWLWALWTELSCHHSNHVSHSQSLLMNWVTISNHMLPVRDHGSTYTDYTVVTVTMCFCDTMLFPRRVSDCSVTPIVRFWGSMSCFGSVSDCNVVSSLCFCDVLIIHPATYDHITLETVLSLRSLPIYKISLCRLTKC